MINMSVTQRGGVVPVELEDLKSSNLLRRRQRQIGSEFQQVLRCI